jgi:hypothetical protein
MHPALLAALLVHVAVESHLVYASAVAVTAAVSTAAAAAAAGWTVT